jgi:hypothetical protein
VAVERAGHSRNLGAKVFLAHSRNLGAKVFLAQSRNLGAKEALVLEVVEVGVRAAPDETLALEGPHHRV